MYFMSDLESLLLTNELLKNLIPAEEHSFVDRRHLTSPLWTEVPIEFFRIQKNLVT